MSKEDVKQLEENAVDYKALFEDLQKKYDDLEAEKNSYVTENEDVKKNYEALVIENQKTKELNFTLSRQINTGEELKAPEEYIKEMFLA